MTRGEAEEIFVSVVASGENAAIEMTQLETQVFRVLVGRAIKEMEKKNRSLWLRARDYGIEYRAPYAIIRKHDNNKYKIFRIAEDGTLTPFNKLQTDEATAKITIADKEEEYGQHRESD
jgi:hypothetical protein